MICMADTVAAGSNRLSLTAITVVSRRASDALPEEDDLLSVVW